jgi:hypothetical protein
MAYESSVIIGSGLNPPKLNVPFNFRSKERHLRGTDVVVINPEDSSVGIGGAITQVTVNTTAMKLPTTPLKYRRSLAIRNCNTGSGTVYLGFAPSIVVADGYPLDPGESFPMQINGAIEVWGIADVDVDVRIIEVA